MCRSLFYMEYLTVLQYSCTWSVPQNPWSRTVSRLGVLNLCPLMVESDKVGRTYVRPINICSLLIKLVLCFSVRPNLAQGRKVGDPWVYRVYFIMLLIFFQWQYAKYSVIQVDQRIPSKLAAYEKVDLFKFKDIFWNIPNQPEEFLTHCVNGPIYSKWQWMTRAPIFSTSPFFPFLTVFFLCFLQLHRNWKLLTGMNRTALQWQTRRMSFSWPLFNPRHWQTDMIRTVQWSH